MANMKQLLILILVISSIVLSAQESTTNFESCYKKCSEKITLCKTKCHKNATCRMKCKADNAWCFKHCTGMYLPPTDPRLI
ncbi:hypothetical protein ACHQM5_000825 [Ranunculus cassubicifolius]